MASGARDDRTPRDRRFDQSELYDLAVDSLEDFSVRAVDATGLLLAHRNSLTPAVGLFLSAACNLAPASVAVFDVAVPTPPKHLGYRLRADKTLVLNAPVHSTMVVGAEGLVVNRTDVTTYFGYSPEAAFINLGSCLVFGTDDASVAANLGTVRGSTASETPIFTVGGDRRHRLDADDVDASPDLRAYLDDLRDGLAGDRHALEAFVCNLEPSAPARDRARTARPPGRTMTGYERYRAVAERLWPDVRRAFNYPLLRDVGLADPDGAADPAPVRRADDRVVLSTSHLDAFDPDANDDEWLVDALLKHEVGHYALFPRVLAPHLRYLQRAEEPFGEERWLRLLRTLRRRL